MFIFYKRIFDLIFSLFLLILALPIVSFCILLILVIDKQSPFFFQERSGINGKNFKIIKLQSMKYKNNKLEVTKLGKILRLFKFDELPQLINVLKNDMSIIGPRPLFIEFNQFYKKSHKLRLNIKPGITGLAQIKVRDSADWDQKFNFDVIYLKRMNYSLEIYIIIKTFILILKSFFIKKYRPLESINYKKNFYDNYCKC